MLQRRRPRATDPATAALARALLNAGELVRRKSRPPDADEQARLVAARLDAQGSGYLIGVTYAEAILNRGRELGLASASGLADAIERARKYRAIAETASATLRADAGW